MKSFAVLSLALLASASHAQQVRPFAGGGGGGGTGHWRFERTVSGSTKATMTSPTGAKTGYVSTWYPGADDGGAAVDPGWTLAEDGSGTWTVRAIWVDADGREGAAATNPKPPAKLLLKFKSSASWEYTGFGSNGYLNSRSGSASNGFGDVYVEYSDNFDTYAWGQMSGAHVKKFNSSGGVVTFKVSQSVAGSVRTHPSRPSSLLALHHLLGVAEDPREATIVREGAHDEWTDADGRRCGDTIYSVPGGAAPGVPVYSRFKPVAGGNWSVYPDPSWPYPNVRVNWDGLDASYERSPKYNFDYSYLGCYLQRQNPFPSSGPANGMLTLKLTDLGDPDKVDATDFYLLSYHKPGDNWRQTGIRKEVEAGDGQYWVGISRPQGQSTYSANITATRTVTKSDEINITGGFNYTISKDTLAMPVAFGYKRTETSAVGAGVGAGVSGQWPNGAASLTVYTKLTKDFDVGLIDKYDEGGAIGKDVPAEQHDKDSTYLTMVVVFFDANGNRLP